MNESKNTMVEAHTTEDFGNCPTCHKWNGYMNANFNQHWGVCHEHKTKWRIGDNLFMAWEHMPLEVLEAQHDQLEGYREVESWDPPKSPAVPFVLLWDTPETCGVIHQAETVIGDDGLPHVVCPCYLCGADVTLRTGAEVAALVDGQTFRICGGCGERECEALVLVAGLAVGARAVSEQTMAAFEELAAKSSDPHLPLLMESMGRLRDGRRPSAN